MSIETQALLPLIIGVPAIIISVTLLTSFLVLLWIND